MRELIIGIIISLLLVTYGIFGKSKSIKKLSLIDSALVLIISVLVCMILKRPDVLEVSIFLVIALTVMIDTIVENIKKNN